jgi:hypothetical protein
MANEWPDERQQFIEHMVDKVVWALDRLTDAIIEDRKISLGLDQQTKPQTPVQANVICLHCDRGPVKETERFYFCEGCGEVWPKQPYKPPKGGSDEGSA